MIDGRNFGIMDGQTLTMEGRGDIGRTILTMEGKGDKGGSSSIVRAN